MKLLLLGPVGSGKGTLAAKLSKEYNIPHISTGEIFRYNIQNNTELGKLAKPYVDSGELVPEELTFKIVEDRLSKADCENGFILDGFPRTLPQAEVLDEMLEQKGIKLDAVIEIQVPDEIIIKENKSGHTRDNAFLSRKVVDENGLKLKTAIIVCKAFHARRCLMLYQLAFPDVTFYVCPVNCYNITRDNWFETEQGIDRVLGELARCGNQFVGDIKEYLK